MHDTLQHSHQVDPHVQAKLDELVTLSPDEQVRQVNELNWLAEEESTHDQDFYLYATGALRAIGHSDAPIAFLAHDMARYEPRQHKKYIYDTLEDVQTLGGSIPVTMGWHGALRISEAACKEQFAAQLPHAPEKSVERFMHFWSNVEPAAIIRDRFGVDMARLGLSDQVNIINFVIDTPWNSPRLQQVQSFFETYGPERGVVSLRALEFGDDYGDSILTIAEKASPEQSKEIFGTIASFRESSAAIAKWYEAYDPKLAGAIKMAMNERLTDALYAMEALVQYGHLEIDVAPHRDKPDYENDGRFMMRLGSLAEGLEILHGLEKSLRLQHEIVTAQDVSVSRVIGENNSQFMAYRFSSAEQGDVLLYIRPEGAKGYDPNFEYGNFKGVEASISFIVNPTDPKHLRSDKDPQGVSIRFDREGRAPHETPFSEDRDPTREEGSISLDVSSGLGDGRHMPVKIGRLIAAGNILRAAKTGGEVSLHHNVNHFDQQRYGNREGFAKLAIYVAHMAEAMISMQQNGTHGSRYKGLPGILRHAGIAQ